MTEQEIKRIRGRFILISTLTLFCVMLLMGGCIYLFSTITLRNEVRQIIKVIVANDGDLPAPEEAETGPAEEPAQDAESDSPHSFSEEMEWSLQGIFGIGNYFGEMPDYIYTTRYFAVLFDQNSEIEAIKASHITYIDDEQAEHYARIAMKRMLHFGSFGRYYYAVSPRIVPDGGVIVIYLDRTSQITLISRMLFAALTILGFGTLLSFFFMRFFSAGIVRSEMRNVESQKQFITNASHELKTPLAVIRANTEMQEMLEGETEWTRSTMRQTDRLSALIQNLVQIARAQEKDQGAARQFDVSAVISETADTFSPVALSTGKTLTKDLPESLPLTTDEGKVRQLASILLDNAVKYCDENGTISVRLVPEKKGAVLTVSNDYSAGADVDCRRFFERFYREDKARTISSGSASENSTGPGGYGIGLSIAESIVNSMHGSIDASWKDGIITFTCHIR